MKFLKKHKVLIISIIILLLTLIYTSFNTFLSNDDLPYMFFYRGNKRITNLIQVIKNQVADYKHINGRFFIHCIIQALLIFDKKLWSILNPLVIVSLLLLITNIVKLITKEKSINYKYFILTTILFLLLFNYKYIIYWVSGSVNYIWVSLALFTFIFYYLKKGIDNNYILNSIVILMVSILHEMSLVFMIIFIIGHIVLKKIKHESINKKTIYYFIAITISTLFIMLSPGNRSRMLTDTTWASLNIIEKIKLSLPVVSYNLFNIKDYYNIIPLVLIISIIYNLLTYKEKKASILAILLFIISFISVILNNGYLYFLLAIMSFICISYIHIINKNYNLIIISLGFYAMVYSTIIVPNYMDGRPNLFFYMYAITIVSIFLNKIINLKYTKYLLLIMFIFTIGNEIHIYKEIGNIHHKRLERIEECKESNCNILTLEKMPKKYSKYHIDSNSPSNKKYYTYRFFLQYYNLPKDINIKLEVEK